MRNPLRDVIQGRMDEKEDVGTYLYGVLGNGSIVEVPNKPPYVYVTLNDGIITQAYNVTCPNILNFPVVVGYDKRQASRSTLSVLTARVIPRQGATETNNFNVRLHHSTHEWMNSDGGNDIVYVQNRQLMALRPTPVGNWNLYIAPDIQKINHSWAQVGGLTYSLLNRRVTGYTAGSSGDEMLLLVSLDTTSGSMVFTNGIVKALGTATMADVPATPELNIPICAIKFWTGQTDIIEALTQTDLADLRFVKNLEASGSSGYAYIQRYGFVDNSQTSLNFSGSSFAFTLTAGSGFTYQRNSVVCSGSGSKSVSLTSGSALAKDEYYIYIDSTDGTLVSSTSAWTLLDTKVPVAIVLWDASLTPNYWIMDERHQCIIDRRMHYYEHTTEGTRYISGGVPSGYSTVGTGDTDADNTYGISTTYIADEDLNQTLSALADTSGSTNNYVSFYRNNSTNIWNWEYSMMPFRYSGSAGYIQYDNSGSMTDGAASKYYNSYLLYTNLSGSARYIVVNGRGEFANLAAAQVENAGTWDWTGIPISEFIIAYQFTWEAKLSYGSKGKVKLAANPVKVNISLTQTAVSSPGLDHNSLAGLQGGMTGQRYHITAAELSAVQNISGSTGGVSNNEPFITSGSSAALTNYRELVAGANITFDDSIPNKRSVIGSGGGGGGVSGSGWVVNQWRYVSGSTNISISGSVFSLMQGMSIVMTTGSGLVEVGAQIGVGHSVSGNSVGVQLLADGVLLAASATKISTYSNGGGQAFSWLGLSTSGSHTYEVKWGNFNTGGSAYNRPASQFEQRILSVKEYVKQTVPTSTLAGLTDVSISGSQSVGDSLVWNGTKWTSGSGSATVYSGSGVSGSGVTNQVAVWSGTNSITGNSLLTFNSSTSGSPILTIGNAVVNQGESAFKTGNGLRIAASGSTSGTVSSLQVMGKGYQPSIQLINIPIGGSPSVNDTTLGEIVFMGSSGSTLDWGAYIKATTNTNWSSGTSGSKGTYLTFYIKNYSGTENLIYFHDSAFYSPINNSVDLGKISWAYRDIYAYRQTLKSSGSAIGTIPTPSGSSATLGVLDDGSMYVKKADGSSFRLGTSGSGQMFVSGAGMRPTAGSAGAISGSGWQTSTNNQTLFTTDFSASVNQSAEAYTIMPDNYKSNSAINVLPIWTGITSGSISGSVAWSATACAYGYVNGGFGSLDVSWGTSGSSIETYSGSTAYFQNGYTSIAITAGGSPNSSQPMLIKITRLADNANDTFPDIARLLGLRILYSLL